MKRFTRALFGALLLTLGISATANAAWIYQPVKWSHNNASTTDLSVQAWGAHRGYLRDTTWIPMAASKVDTTAEFSLTDAEIPTPGELGRYSTTADTLYGAFLLLVSDSSVASSVNFKGTAVTVQVNYGQGAGWQTAHCVSALPTDGVKILPVGFVTGNASAADGLIDMTSGLLSFGAPRYRAIVTGGASVAAPSTRVYVKKFVRSTKDFDSVP